MKTRQGKCKTGGRAGRVTVSDTERGNGTASGHGARVISLVLRALPSQLPASTLSRSGATSTAVRGAIIESFVNAQMGMVHF